MKRNPFKKTPVSGGKAPTNAFKHLTDRALGFDSQETQDMAIGDTSIDTQNNIEVVTNGKSGLNKENHSAKISVNMDNLF